MSVAVSVRECQIAAKPPKELVDFAKRQVVNAKLYRGVERRSEGRDFLVVPVLVQPVDEDFRAIGPRFDIVTRELSPKGIGLVHYEPIQHELLALHMCLAGNEVNLVARVVWCKPLGPFYGTGAKFISKLKEFPRESDVTLPKPTPGPHQLSPLALATEQCMRALKGLTDDCRRR